MLHNIWLTRPWGKSSNMVFSPRILRRMWPSHASDTSCALWSTIIKNMRTSMRVHMVTQRVSTETSLFLPPLLPNLLQNVSPYVQCCRRVVMLRKFEHRTLILLYNVYMIVLYYMAWCCFLFSTIRLPSTFYNWLYFIYCTCRLCQRHQTQQHIYDYML